MDSAEFERTIRQHRREEPFARLITGLAILTAGVLIWLDHLGRIDAWDYLRWWSVVLIAYGLVNLVARRWSSAVILIVIGLVFLPRFPLFHDFYLRDVLALSPLFISVAGVTLVVQSLRPVAKDAASGGTLRAISIMGGNGRTFGGDEFVGGDVVSVMGGCDIDLTRATLSREAVIDILAFWGGVAIKIPRTWRVESRMATVIGALVDNTSGGTQNGPVLVLRGSVIMGGVEVKSSSEERA
ncbi:MAG TPA: LiaF domain-containing protein [Thermoanaerobaculia bacterium]